MLRISAFWLSVVLWASPVAATDIRLENPLVIQQLRIEPGTNTASLHARGGTACPDEEGEPQPLLLPLASVEAEVLYALLLAAHLGERQLAIWHDIDLDCRIVQGQLSD